MTEPPTCDVLVIGAGGSGLAAAVSAAQHGGQVIVLEKRPQPGGTTGIAVGSFTAAGTPWQRAAGIEDRPEDHAQDAARFAAPDIEACNNHDLRGWFLRESAATLDWLASLGLAFYGPSPEPPNRVPRMHNVVPGAKAYIAALQLALRRHGGKLICSAVVEELVREKGRVAGAQVRLGERREVLLARRGVILAAGDYAANRQMIAQYKGEAYRQIESINPFADGDGHRLAEAAGAELVNMDITYGPELRFVPSRRRPFQQWLPASGPFSRVMGALAERTPDWIMRRMIKRLLVTWQHPENALFDDGAILVNRQGERFVNERRWPERELALARQPDKEGFLVLDGRLMERYSAWPHFISTAPDIAYAYAADYLRLRPDVAVSGASLAEIAPRRGIDDKALALAIEQFNAYASGAAPDRFGREGDDHGLRGGPWMLLGPVRPYFTTTEGGVRVDRRLRALDASGEPIPGLWAVGQTGLGGMILWGHGLHIAWAMTSGRLAGKSVMESNESE